MSRYRYEDDEDDDDFDANGVLKDGRSVRTSMFAIDALSPVQQAIARSSMRLCDEMGNPPSNQPGFVRIADSGERAERRAEDRDFQKAELSARWKGGLQQGDHLQLGDRLMEVVGHNPENGKVRLAETGTLDAESIKQEAYDSYERDVTSAWQTDGRKLVVQRDPLGRLKSTFEFEGEEHEPDDNEWQMAGPLSDATEAKALKDAAYDAYRDELENAWRR